MDKEVGKYFFDDLESINIIEKHLSGINNFSLFSQNLLIQDAVQRRLAIIGEALWKASKTILLLTLPTLEK